VDQEIPETGVRWSLTRLMHASETGKPPLTIDVLQRLYAEQQRTNALLEQVVDRLDEVIARQT
jgi:ferritin